MSLTVHPDLTAPFIGTDLAEVDTNRLFTAQRPYRNGVVVYRYSLWQGNGFGTETIKVAVRDGVVVGVYKSGLTQRHAYVLGHSAGFTADFEWTGHGETRRQYTTRTALVQWIEAVKAL